MFLSELETGAGLDVVLGLQTGRSPLLDGLAWAFHIAGSDVFLLVLLSGIVTSLLLLANVVLFLLDNYTEQLLAFFAGLILASIQSEKLETRL